MHLINIKNIVFFLLIFSIVSCENDMEKVKLVTAKTKAPSETATNIDILYSDSAKVKVKVFAKKMDHYITDDPYIEMPEGIKVEFYDDTFHVTSHLTANYAIKYEKKNIMEARGNVIVVNEKGEQLNTEYLIWEENTGKIHSPDFVKITTTDEIIYGNGFESNQNFTKYKIFDIKGTISLNKQK